MSSAVAAHSYNAADRSLKNGNGKGRTSVKIREIDIVSHSPGA